MIRHEVDFPYKGERDYVSGADIFDKVIDKSGSDQISELTVSFNKIMKNTSGFMLFSKSEFNADEKSEASASGRMVLDQEALNFILVEKQADEKIERKEYDENQITKRAVIEGDQISLNVKPPYTFIETLVALTKKLHLEKFSKSVGKWYFVQIELDSIVKDFKKLEVIFKHDFNNRLTKSQIVVDKTAVGHIYFSLVK